MANQGKSIAVRPQPPRLRLHAWRRWLGSNLLRELPPEVSSLTALRQLWVPSNQLTALPDGLFSLTQLEWL